MAGKKALTPSTNPAGDTDTGVPTTSRQLGGKAGPGPQQTKTNTPTTDSSPGKENLKRWNETKTSLDGASQAGVQVARHQVEMRRRALLASRSTITDGCQPSLNVYTDQKNAGNLKGGEVGSWICALDEKIKYVEGKYQNQWNEFALFIEGAEVTHYVEGAISWTIESTGGQNSCRFTLNNTQDAFIITPENICAGLNPKGWRISGLLPEGTYSRRGNPMRKNYRVDETAKFIIYYNKYHAVDPEKKHHEPQIDQQTGMWLYPLNPYSCIFNKHDCVRLFIRLPHVSSVRRANTTEWYDLWMPAFTGFIRDYNWDDDPVKGTRYVRVSCYDYRGLMERMRVRVAGIGTQVPSGVQPNGARGPDGRPKGPAQDPKAAVISASTPGKGGSTSEAFLEAAKVCGQGYESFFKRQGYMKHIPPGTSFSQGFQLLNPYSWALQYKLIDAFKELYAAELAAELVRKGVVIKLGAGAAALSGIDYSSSAVQQAIAAADRSLSKVVTSAIGGIGQVLGLSCLLYQATGEIYDLQIKGFVAGTGATPVFLTSKIDTTSNTAGSGKGGAFTKASNAVKKKAADEAAKKAALDKKSVHDAISKAASDYMAIRGYFNVFVLSSSPTPIPISDLDKTVRQVSDDYIKARLENNYLAMMVAKVNVGKVTSYFLNLKSDYNSSLNKNETVRNLVAGTALSTAYQNTGVNNPNYDIYVPLSDIEKNSAKPGTTLSVEQAQAAYWKTVQDSSNASLNYNSMILDLKNRYNGIIDGFKNAYKYFATSTTLLPDVAVQQLQLYSACATVIPVPINYTSKWFYKRRKELEKYILSTRKSLTEKAVKTTLYKMAEAIKQERDKGKANAKTNRVQVLSDVTHKFVDFDKATVGVVFGDLVKATQFGHPHPLAGKSFEEAIHFLCTEQSMLQSGAPREVSSYDRSALDTWNRVVVFGAIQRPLTYREMMEVGEGTVRDFDSDFCPLKAFYHILLPVKGTGAQSIVRQHIGGENLNAKTEPQYKTRLELINELCESLDYQFFVSPMGDLIFEVPVYNAYPDTFGSIFKGAYTISKDWIKSSISEEQSEVPTGWVIQGSEVDKQTNDSTGSSQAAHQLQKLTILNNIMARRLGARVEYVTIKVPGIGALIGSAGGDPKNAQQQMAAYAAFYIQRQLSRAHVLTVSHPFRPYVVPNRPLWLIPRQRIGLVTTVTHTLNPPNGACTTDVSIGYVRWLFRDGTFRFIGGGERQPLDYIGFFAGATAYKPTEGTRAINLGDILPAQGASQDSPSVIANRFRAANAFSANVYASYAEIPEQADPAVKQQTAVAQGTVLTSNPSTTATAASQNQANKAASDQANKANASTQTNPNSNPPPKKKTPAPAAQDVQFRKNGYFVSGGGHNDEQQPKGDAKKWQFLDKVISPWRYGSGVSLFNSWGFLRKNQGGYYGKQNWNAWHPGMDICVRSGLPLLCPIEADRVTAELNIFRRARAQRGLRNLAAAGGRSYTRYSNQVPILGPDGRPVLGPDGQATYRNERGKKIFPAANFFLVNDTMYWDAKNDYGKSAPKYEVYTEYWDAYVAALAASPKPEGQKLKYLQFDINGGVRGIVVNLYGYFVPSDQILSSSPNPSGSRRMRIQLQYLHMSKFAATGDGVIGADFTGNGKSTVVSRGDVVGYVGNTGLSASPHLHVNMYILGPDYGTDPELYKFVAKANEEFLTAQLLARATGWDQRKPLTPDMLNDPVAKKWEGYAKYGSGRKKGTYTNADFIKWYLSRSSYNSGWYGATRFMYKGKYTNRIQTNAMFFFRPEELVDMTGVRRSISNKRIFSSFEPRNQGYPNVKPPGAVIPPAYNGTDLRWCSGLNGSRVDSTAAAKASKARADANKAISANPQNAAAEKQKLKNKLEKAAAPAKAAEDEAKKANKNPQAIRRKFNAIARKAREKQAVAEVGKPTVSPRQTTTR